MLNSGVEVADLCRGRRAAKSKNGNRLLEELRLRTVRSKKPTERLEMANRQEERKPKRISTPFTGERGLKSGPPRPRTVARIPKQWQPPKNENTPNRRIKRT